MTANEIISKVDALQPNQYSFEQKLGWLSQVDGEIFKDVILTHHHPSKRIMERAYRDPDNRHNMIYSDYESGDDVLIVGKPYADNLYVYYLQAMIAMENSEIAKYSQYSSLYNSAYVSWAGHYNRDHVPLHARGGNRFRF